jgi:hypothetical protein
MSISGFHHTRAGEIWGSQAQQAAVKKAAEASARKRRKNHPDPQDMRDRHQGPTVDEVIANAVNYPSQAAYSQALNEARQRARVAAGGPATVPKGKILGSDGKLRNATPKSSDILVGGKVHTPDEIARGEHTRPALESERIQARIDMYKQQLKNPDFTGASTAAMRQNRIEGIEKNIRYHEKQLRTAKNNEATAAANAARAARTPEQKAADDAREAENGRQAQIAKLRKTIADHPGSWAASMAQEKLDAIEQAARTGVGTPKTRKPEPREGDEIEMEMGHGGARRTGKIVAVYDTFSQVALSNGDYVNVHHSPGTFDNKLIRVKKRAGK